jgi:ATP-dependent RNA helicase DHX57
MFLGVENGTGNFLGKMLDPPTDQSVRAAIFSLQKLGAIMADSPVEGSLKLTPLGMHLAGIPAPPTVGKSEFRCFSLTCL